MGKLLIAIAAALCATSCASRAPTRAVAEPTRDWPAVPASAIREVRPERIQAAVDLLTERESVPVDEAQIAELAEPSHCAEPGDTAYLVRGVAYGVATLVVVRQDPDSGSVAVWQGTWNGNNPVYGAMMRDKLPAPVIVRLPRAPTRVLTAAEVGGDALARRDRSESGCTGKEAIQ